MAARRWMIVAAGAVLALSCDSPTEPAGGRVAVTASIWAGPSTVIENEWPWISCDVQFVATAAGKGRVRWRSATARWFYGIDRSEPADTLVLNGGDLESAFYSDSLVGPASDTAVFRISAPAPFDIETTFRFTRGNGLETFGTTARVACGPEVEPGAPEPTVEIVSVTPSVPQPQPGDVLFVRYRARGTAGIWFTGIEFAGAFGGSHSFIEGGLQIRDRTVSVTIPANAELAFPVRVRAYAYDAGLRVVSTDTTTPIFIADLTPPTISATMPSGQWATDDSVRVQGTAADNHQLAWIVWEVGDPALRRDSVSIAEPRVSSHAFDVKIPLRPEWAGLDAKLTLWARDASGRISLPVESAANALRLYAGVVIAPPVVATYGPSVGGTAQAYDVVHDAARQRLYAAHPDQAAISTFDLVPFSRGPSVPTLARPYGIDFSGSRDSLIVAHAQLNKLSVIRLDDLVSLSTVSVHAIDSLGSVQELVASGVRVTSTGIAVIAFDGASADGTRIVTVDLANSTSRARRESARGQERYGEWFRRLRETPDRGRIAIFELNCARFYRAATDDFSACAPMPNLVSNGVAFSADANRITFGDKVLGANFEPVRILPGETTLIAPDGLTAIVKVDRRIIRVRLSDGRYLAGMRIPLEFADLLFFADGGQSLVVLSRGTGQVIKLPLAGF